MEVENPLAALQSFPTDEKEEASTLDQTGMDRDAFLKIFIEQLRNQDPLSPKEAGDMAVQLAQFSQLEQSVVVAEELRSVSGKLEEILQELRGSRSSALDPLSMLGREVDLDGDELHVPVSGSSTALRFDLPTSARALGIEVLDPLGGLVGVASLNAPASEVTITNDDGTTRTEFQFQDLPRGRYQLLVADVDGRPQLRLLRPDGAFEELMPVRARLDEERGAVLELDESGGTLPLHLARGGSYRFAIGGASTVGAPLEPRTTISATADGVRVVDGEPVLSVNGVDVPLSQITQIR